MKIDRMGEIVVVDLEYDHLDADNIEIFKGDIIPLIEKERQVIFDLNQLNFSDSSGLGAFLSCLRRLKASGGDLKLCGMNAAVRALFELVRMHRVIEIYNDREEAIRAFTGKEQSE